MTSVLELIALVLFILASSAGAVYWSAVSYHVLRTRRLIPTARAGLKLDAPDDETVCVIVPAHNEAACIGDLARSLVAQDHPRMTCVFVLDRCTDDTRAVIEQTWQQSSVPDGRGKPALEILEISDCPPEWTGKSHALWRAVNDAHSARSAQCLLFIDADTWLDPGLVRASAALRRQQRSHMLSLLSTLTHDRWFEQVVQPATILELMRQYPIVRANARPPARRRAFANGQFILIERDAYLRIGGHDAIKGEVLEDVLLARRCEAQGLHASLLLSDGLLRCRMYDSFAAFAQGWRRIYSESANRKPARLRQQAMRVRLLGTIVPLLSVAAIVFGLLRLDGPHHHLASTAMILGAVATGIYAAAILLIYGSGRIPLWGAPAFPVGCWITGSILRQSARDLEARRPIIWAGKQYVREPRR